MRRRFRQDRETGELVEITGARQARPPAGPLVMADLAPYQSTITGETISGRRAHREHMALHECQEIGDQIPKFLRDKYERDGVIPRWGKDGRRIG